MSEEKKNTESKQRTVSVMKEKRQVPQSVKDKSKHFARIRRSIENALKAGPKTIPRLSEEIDMPKEQVMYYVMSMHKFGQVIAGEVNDDDYYLYELPKK